jgi:hypothetical protein
MIRAYDVSPPVISANVDLNENTHPSPFSDSYIAVKQIRGIIPRIKAYHSDPSMDRRIKSFDNLNRSSSHTA